MTEGPRSVVRAVRIFGLEGLGQETRRAAEDAMVLTDGLFSIAGHRENKARLLQTVRGAGHARAQLIAQVDAFPEEQAVDLTYVLVPGPVCVFGALRFEGVESIQEGFLRSRIDIARPSDHRRRRAGDSTALWFACAARGTSAPVSAGAAAAQKKWVGRGVGRRARGRGARDRGTRGCGEP